MNKFSIISNYYIYCAIIGVMIVFMSSWFGFFTYRTHHQERNFHAIAEARSIEQVLVNNFSSIIELSPNANQAYQTFDEDPLSGVAYYRLKVRFANGALHFSPPEPIAFNTEAGYRIGPNPARENLIIELFNPRTTSAQLSLFALNGQQVFRSNLELIPTTPNVQQINLSHLPKGIYLYRIEEGEQVYQGKLIIQ